jgi:hypothetical protein
MPYPCATAEVSSPYGITSTYTTDEIILEVEYVPASDQRSIDFASKRGEGTPVQPMYEAKLVNTRTFEEFELSQGQTYLLKLLNPTTGQKWYILEREHEDGSFDSVLMNVTPDAIETPVSDFTLYGVEANEAFIEDQDPALDDTFEFDGYAYWVWQLEGGEEIILRMENYKR